MTSKNHINVSRRAAYLALIAFLCLNLTSVTPFFYVEHPIDVLTESAYFSVLVYIRAAISRSITSTRSITVGVNLILFVALYDVLTEVTGWQIGVIGTKYWITSLSKGECWWLWRALPLVLIG
ncbi:hypothetical protein M2H09_14575 [Vibrio vulnificus]|uniref:hypothetical protein n=1 Tax=Vibrio vulnificus TaxID=672 RepID=UPI001E526427|nr:hypothetical protein [Vibrio vulnificus]MCU8206533.1 hypothetical protein [Vibrio vulnificus]